MQLFILRIPTSASCARNRLSVLYHQAHQRLYSDAAVAVSRRKSTNGTLKKDQVEGSWKEAKCVSAVEAYPEILSKEWQHQIAACAVDGVTIVRDTYGAVNAIKTLCELEEQKRVVAWDTETTGIDPRRQTPYGNGRAICATAYAGRDVDFGDGPYLFIDIMDGEEGLIEHFKAYFEKPTLQKVWHNYSFDKHILYNHGILARGFAGDTMHMARLVDSSRQRYSLEELAKDYLGHLKLEKVSMLDRFGHKRILKNGGEGKETVVPDTITLQRHIKYRSEWIKYATMDAKLTYELCSKFSAKLRTSTIDGKNCVPGFLDSCSTLYDIFFEYLIPFGNMLTDMERFGFKVDVEQLRLAELSAENDRLKLEDSFRAWAAKQSPDAVYMNVHSDRQKQHLLFAPCKNKKNRNQVIELEKTFVVEQTGLQAKRLIADGQEKVKGAKKVKKKVTIRGLGKAPIEYTSSGWPSVNAASLRKLAGTPRSDPPVYGAAGDPEMCHALADVIEASSIVSLLSNFIVPLQSWPGADGRIHASLNVNTETGRLSSRRPNLMNQPALEKDRYKVRRAFVCEPGNRLIVADYGQLELRLMAHVTKCASMLEAFEAGGDFHSRTAITMFDHVASAVENGEVILERRSEGDADVPLVKEVFATERRQAKTLNFSIAYGKTAMGLAKDWGVSTLDARDILELWYRERQEVRAWQQQCRWMARHKGYVETILGRRRHLPDAMSSDKMARAHAERAAINAPLQGSAADVVMVAMMKLHQNAVLHALGWRVILQVHDEVILEGPAYSAHAALPEVQRVMCNPLKFPLLVDLTVDSSVVSCWYDAK